MLNLYSSLCIVGQRARMAQGLNMPRSACLQKHIRNTISCKPYSIITYHPKIKHFHNYTNALLSCTKSLPPFGWLCDTMLLTMHKTHRREQSWKQSALCEPPQPSCTHSFLCSDLLGCIYLYLRVFVLFLIKMSEKCKSTSNEKTAKGNQY